MLTLEQVLQIQQLEQTLKVTATPEERVRAWAMLLDLMIRSEHVFQPGPDGHVRALVSTN